MRFQEALLQNINQQINKSTNCFDVLMEKIIHNLEDLIKASN